MPLILKGVQCWEDALEAYDMGLAGIVLSNHGGRQLEFARSGIEVLVEVVAKLKEKRGLSFPNKKFQLFIDGGVRRATDVIKAVALGASAGTMTHVRLCFSLTRCNSWGGSPVPLFILVIRTRGCRKGLANSTCRIDILDSFAWVLTGPLGGIRDEYATAGST